jgi:hypothetical protein
MEKDFCNIKWTKTDEGFKIEFKGREFMEFFENCKNGNFNCCGFERGSKARK